MLNYNAQKLINEFKQRMSSIRGTSFILNQGGHLILADIPEHEWGDMFESRRHITFQHLYPSFTKKYNKIKSGVVYTHYGVFFIRDISASMPLLSSSDLKVKIIWALPWRQLIPIAVVYYLIFGAVMLFFAFFLSWRLAVSKIKNKEYEIELEAMSKTDPLTKTSNRRQLYFVGDEEMKRSLRVERPFSILMLDIDKFKHINDKYRHKYGDIALTTLAETINASIRATDTVARYGGEEFVLILPFTAHKSAVVFAEQLRQKIANIKIPYEQDTFSFTVSIGVSSWHKTDKDLAQIID